jgi:hypothetical protein
LRHIAGVIRRLDPTSATRLQSGMRLRVTGLDLPPELGLHLSLSLEDQTSAAGPTDGASLPAPRRVGEFPIQLDQTAWVGVADGRYRLELSDGSRTGTSGEHLGSRGIQMTAMLRMDFSDLPKEVEIRGETIDLPAIRAYLLEDIRVLEPNEGESVDFANAVFRWNAIPEARRYEVGFSVTTREAGATYYRPFLVTGTDGAATLRAAGLPADSAAKLRGLAPGTTGTGEVRAYDAQRRVIAKSPQQRTFTVGK